MAERKKISFKVIKYWLPRFPTRKAALICIFPWGIFCCLLHTPSATFRVRLRWTQLCRLSSNLQSLDSLYSRCPLPWIFISSAQEYPWVRPLSHSWQLVCWGFSPIYQIHKFLDNFHTNSARVKYLHWLYLGIRL